MTGRPSVEPGVHEPGSSADVVLAFDDVRVWTAEGAQLLRGVTWEVRAGEHWAVLGANGAGKSTLLSLAAARRHPSSGTVSILGRRMGQTMVFRLWEVIGVVDPNLRLPDELTCAAAVLTGLTGSLRPQFERITPADEERAMRLLDQLGCLDLADRTMGTCSQGERQRVRIARSLMTRPRLLLLDEPATGLDLPAREALLAAVTDLRVSDPDLAIVVVAHHLEDLPAGTGRAMLMARGRAVAQGPADEILTSGPISECFGIPIEVTQRDGRWAAHALPGWRRSSAPEVVPVAEGDFDDSDW